MTAPRFVDVDPRTLRLPPTRPFGADPVKLQRQIAQHGNAVSGTPPLFLYRGSDGELMISDGVTRATRVAKLLPGTLVRGEIIGELNSPLGSLPTLGERIP